MNAETEYPYSRPIEEQNDHHLGFPKKDAEYVLHQHPTRGWIREYRDYDKRVPLTEDGLAPEVAGTARATAATMKALELARMEAGVR